MKYPNRRLILPDDDCCHQEGPEEPVVGSVAMLVREVLEMNEAPRATACDLLSPIY